jgi:hypothetical protein
MVDTPRATSVSGVPYDGVTFPYVSGPTLRIDPRLQLHREWTDKHRPHHLRGRPPRPWNVNEELGMTIQRTSGSPVGILRQFCRPACSGLIENEV